MDIEYIPNTPVQFIKPYIIESKLEKKYSRFRPSSKIDNGGLAYSSNYEGNKKQKIEYLSQLSIEIPEERASSSVIKRNNRHSIDESHISEKNNKDTASIPTSINNKYTILQRINHPNKCPMQSFDQIESAENNITREYMPSIQDHSKACSIHNKDAVKRDEIQKAKFEGDKRITQTREEQIKTIHGRMFQMIDQKERKRIENKDVKKVVQKQNENPIVSNKDEKSHEDSERAKREREDRILERKCKLYKKRKRETSWWSFDFLSSYEDSIAETNSEPESLKEDNIVEVNMLSQGRINN
jgi:hypothetical protein